MLVRFFHFFLIFWKVFFEEGKEKIIIIFGEIREKGKMDLARAKKVFSASRQKKNLFKVLAVIVFLKALLFSG